MPVKVSTLIEENPTEEQVDRISKLLMSNPGMAYTSEELRSFLGLERFSEILSKIVSRLTLGNKGFKSLYKTEANYYWYE